MFNIIYHRRVAYQLDSAKPADAQCLYNGEVFRLETRELIGRPEAL